MYRQWSSDEIQHFVFVRHIKWKFNIEAALWWGGFWERLVHSVKTSLRKTLEKAAVATEALRTVLCEVEAILNSRPLTYVDTNINEPKSLTPSHFLVGKCLTLLPKATKDYKTTTTTTEDITSRWTYELVLDNKILKLKSFHKVRKSTKSNLKLGDLVLIEGPSPKKFLEDGQNCRNVYRKRRCPKGVQVEVVRCIPKLLLLLLLLPSLTGTYPIMLPDEEEVVSGGASGQANKKKSQFWYRLNVSCIVSGLQHRIHPLTHSPQAHFFGTLRATKAIASERGLGFKEKSA